MIATLAVRESVASSLRAAPILGVVRTASIDEAERQARTLIAGGVQLVEITFSVPGATQLVRNLLHQYPGASSAGAPWIGMGTVTTRARAEDAVAAGARFLVSPNCSEDVAAVAREHDVFLVLGALTPTEIVRARELGADLVKVYPLPPVGGPSYLSVIRQPLADIPMLAAGGFPVSEIPAYRAAGASAFGMAATLLGDIPLALRLARGLVS
ncbi:MAG: bifunctional 4-hydroxy-2-oxoglutarate aldolase/2-dehydro-3-deoxy-phosphogluconate aldolase [Acidobacteriota bacterium]